MRNGAREFICMTCGRRKVVLLCRNCSIVFQYWLHRQYAFRSRSACMFVDTHYSHNIHTLKKIREAAASTDFVSASFSWMLLSIRLREVVVATIWVWLRMGKFRCCEGLLERESLTDLCTLYVCCFWN